MIKFSKKVICLILGACVTLSGCGNDKDVKSVADNNSKTMAMGRYVEEVVELPYNKDTEVALSLLQNNDNALELYVGTGGEEKYYPTEIGRYTMQSDGTWVRDVPAWVNNELMIGNDTSSQNIIMGNDGYLYGSSASGDKLLPHIVKNTEGDNWEEIKIPELNKIEENIGYYPMIQHLSIMENGLLAISFYTEGKIYNPEDGSKVMDFATSTQGPMTVSGTKVISNNEDGTAVKITDTERGQADAEISYGDKMNSASAFCVADDGTIYIGNTQGIHSTKQDGTIFETLVDGSLTSLSMPSLYLLSVLKGEGDEFYTFLGSSDGASKTLLKYTYNKDVPSLPDSELTIYSLNDNDTVRQAIGEFQRNNPTARVTFRIAMGEDSGTTISDNIKVLNTELLAGKGADIIILDGLPVESYIEKGVLEDLSGISEELINSGDLLKNIIDSSRTGDKLYFMPTRVQLVTALGRQDILDSTKSLEALGEFAEKNTGKPLLNKITYKDIIETFLPLELGNILNTKSEIDNTAMIQFFDSIKKITKGVDMGEDELIYYGNSDFNVGAGDALINISEITGIADVMIAEVVAKDINGDIINVNGLYKPVGNVGINSAGTNKELANKFVRELISQQVQDLDLGDGFSVNPKSLEVWNNTKKDISYGIGSPLSDYNITAAWPEKEVIAKYTNMCSTVTTPVKEDYVISEMIMNEAGAFLKGEKTAEETANTITERARTYIAE